MLSQTYPGRIHILVNPPPLLLPTPPPAPERNPNPNPQETRGVVKLELGWQNECRGKACHPRSFFPRSEILDFAVQFHNLPCLLSGINLSVCLLKVWLLILLEWRALAVFELRFRAKTSCVGRILFSCVEG